MIKICFDCPIDKCEPIYLGDLTETCRQQIKNKIGLAEFSKLIFWEDQGYDVVVGRFIKDDRIYIE